MDIKDLQALVGQDRNANGLLESAYRSLGGKGEFERLVKDMNEHKELLSAAYGPIEELRSSGVLKDLAEQGHFLEHVKRQLLDANQQFGLLDLDQTRALADTYLQGDTSELFKAFYRQENDIKSALAEIRTPWLNMGEQMRSVSAFADLQSIGFALNNVPAFDDNFANLLRADLGDWQERLTIPEVVYEDPLARSAFYQERGLDRHLAAFPAEAFSQSLDLAQLRGKAPKIIDLYDFKEEPAAENQEAGFARTNAAHDRLQRFETQLRQFIDDQMTKVVGDQWIKHRVPGDMYKGWLAKQEKARATGENDYPLIAYADFTDYADIIIRKDNWTEIFQPVFNRKEYIRESLQRLYPIRICTMHARMITQDDEIYLYVETKRILNCMGI